jgi:hypothetical protein
MKLKVKHFHVYDLITVCFDYASEILCTKYREPVNSNTTIFQIYRGGQFYWLRKLEYPEIAATQYTALVPGILCIVFRLHNQNKQ